MADVTGDYSTNGLVKLFYAKSFADIRYFLPSQASGELSSLYFILPTDFYYDGSKIVYNHTMKWILKSVDVYHNGVHKSEPFYRVEPTSVITCQLNTDTVARLPYVIRPTMDEVGVKSDERCYLIPVVDNGWSDKL